MLLRLSILWTGVVLEFGKNNCFACNCFLLITQFCKQFGPRSGPEIMQLFLRSTQLSTKFILLINVTMPTIVGILTFIILINTRSERLKARNFFICQYFSFVSS